MQMEEDIIHRAVMTLKHSSLSIRNARMPVVKKEFSDKKIYN